MLKIAPSILSADFANLSKELILLDKSNFDYLHIDVMDGNFVPNITVGPCVISSLRKLSNKVFDVHLMIVNPDKHIESFIQSGADIITFHVEAAPSPLKTIQKIKNLGAKVGISLKPGTDIERITDYIKEVDQILVMTVEPGFGGQRFLYEQLHKVKELKLLLKSNNANALISIDGGINVKTGKISVEAGADVLVSGSFIFDTNCTYKEQIDKLRSLSK
ncbi:MAG: ribulose-phosphate 3-epimerase [Rickettsiales bacterium]